MHAVAAFYSEKVNLVAIAERNEAAGKPAAEKYNCKWYADAEEMLVLRILEPQTFWSVTRYLVVRAK